MSVGRSIFSTLKKKDWATLKYKGKFDRKHLQITKKLSYVLKPIILMA